MSRAQKKNVVLFSSCSESCGVCEVVPAVQDETLTGPDAGPAVFIGSKKKRPFQTFLLVSALKLEVLASMLPLCQL